MGTERGRPLIAFFNYSDLFEDFFPYYGVDQQTFATRWAATSNHTYLSLLQREVGDVVWYVFSLRPQLGEARHEVVGCQIRFLRAPILRRLLRWGMLAGGAGRRRFGRREERATDPAAQPAVADAGDATARRTGMSRLYRTVGSYLTMLSGPLLRALLRDRPDFLFVQDYATGRFDALVLLARMLGIPLITIHTGSRPESYLGAGLKRFTIPRATRIIVSGSEEAGRLVERFGVPRDRVRIIQTPVDLRLFRPRDRAGACREAGLDPRRRYLLFVGRLDERPKHVSMLIRAFADISGGHRDTDLLIAGDGPDGPWLRALAEELAPGRIRCLGWVGDAEMLARLYNVAECLVLCSRHEGFPTVVGEALASGTPVLATRVGGVAEVVRDGVSGWLIPPEDPPALVDALSRVLRRPDLVDTMRPQARAMAEARLDPAVAAAALRECFSRPAAALRLTRQSV